MRETFRHLIHTTPGEWKRDDLKTLSSVELRGLCELLGIPTSGTKAEAVERLLSLGGLRQLLADYDDPDYHAAAARLIADFDKRELKGMASMAKLWKSGNKYQLAIGLIQWRNECRRKGQMALSKTREQLSTQPQQLTFAFSKAA
jgi:hypothetical protein